MKASLMSAIAAVALATTVAVPAFAHDAIIPRAGFDSALAATQTPSGDQGQSAAGDEDTAQVLFDAQAQGNSQADSQSQGNSQAQANSQVH
jgi:hypothetical protein